MRRLMNLPIGLWRWELSWSFIAASRPRCLILTLQDTKRRISCGRWSFQWANRAHTGIALQRWCWWVVEKYFQIASNLSKHVMFLIVLYMGVWYVFDMLFFHVFPGGWGALVSSHLMPSVAMCLRYGHPQLVQPLCPFGGVCCGGCVGTA